MTIEENKPLDDLNTFGIVTGAKYFVEIKSTAEFEELVQNEIYRREKKMILGGGSNVLFIDCFDGIVVKNSIKGISVESETETGVIVKANAGEVWHEFV